MLKKILPVSGVLIFLFLSGTVSDVFSFSINLKSNLIVLAGTFACCMISYPASLFASLFKNIHHAFVKDPKDFNKIIDDIERLSAIRRSAGLFELDKKSKKIENSLLRSGIEMVVDGYDRYSIFKTLESGYDNFLEVRRSETDLINTIIKLMPVFGFVGTIIGLINVLNNMGSPELIGKGVATALLTTFYGLLYANIIFLPINKKLAEKTRQDSIEQALIIEGVLDIADEVNTRAIGYRLRYCMGDFYQDDNNFKTKRASEHKKIPAPGLTLKKQGVR